MARDLMPIVKRSRREKVALHPKAIKGMTRRPYGPGQHGQSGGRTKVSQYAIQLREKQKVKRLYGLLEKQFVRVMHEADRHAGVTGDILLQLLESRLDNAVYRSGWATSRPAARQLVTHGHFLLNGRRVDIPSIRLHPGDEVKVRPRSAQSANFEQLRKDLAGHEPSLRWLSQNLKQLTITVTGQPVRDDADPDIQEQLIIEFYSR